MASAAVQQIEVRNRWTNAVQFTAEITCAPDATIGVKIGLAVKWARRNGAFLRGADLSGAFLRGADLSGAFLRGADLRDAVLRDAVLRGADLLGADLRGADLRGADLRGADLSDADLSDAVLRGAVLRDAVLRDAPKIENIHQKVYAAASQPGALNMRDWHTCGTTHCRAGWVTTLAGEDGRKLEERIGTAAAASLIYLASDATIERFPSFYASNEDALADMKAMADAEAAKVTAA